MHRFYTETSNVQLSPTQLPRERHRAINVKKASWICYPRSICQLSKYQVIPSKKLVLCGKCGMRSIAHEASYYDYSAEPSIELESVESSLFSVQDSAHLVFPQQGARYS